MKNLIVKNYLQIFSSLILLIGLLIPFVSDFHSRDKMIDKIVEEETAFAAANCFCRVGDHRGTSLSSYPNAYKDFGKLKRYKGVNQQGKKNQADCGSICSAKAENWARSLNMNQLCSYFKKAGANKLVAYSKVGTKNWTVRQTITTVSCCSAGGSTSCPSGWNAESNFPGYCSKAICPPLVKGDKRLYNKDGSPWGYVWKNMIYQLRKGSTTSTSWVRCN